MSTIPRIALGLAASEPRDHRHESPIPAHRPQRMRTAAGALT